ncbi:hypothetical protein LY78DRAFT_657042 [Colletotrichum sublineola]|uniref:Secreted protein n=1 Tax=Colletotrichum sublineola TaxID=1173701 RepID=A0A066WZK6_COLSU|nr:hypothetical protein LY78DRAFT_657042 [Colletotrichum sublineola]KDN62333.1 hypothetical protein CSUB01_05152 [Colletotrichum sublineola]
MQLSIFSAVFALLTVVQAWTVTVQDSSVGCNHGPNAKMRRIVGQSDLCFNFGDDMRNTDCYQYQWDPKHPQVPAGPAGCVGDFVPSFASYYDRMRRGTKCYFYSQRDCVRSPLGNHHCPANVAFMDNVKIKSFKCITE